MIRYGTRDQWSAVHPVLGEPAMCTAMAMGDPAPRLMGGRHCDCAVKRNSEAWFRLSPAVIPEASAPEPVVSCERIAARAGKSRWDDALQEATAGLCGAAAGGEALPEAGPVSLDRGELR